MKRVIRADCTWTEHGAIQQSLTLQDSRVNLKGSQKTECWQNTKYKVPLRTKYIFAVKEPENMFWNFRHRMLVSYWAIERARENLGDERLPRSESISTRLTSIRHRQPTKTGNINIHNITHHCHLLLLTAFKLVLNCQYICFSGDNLATRKEKTCR